MDEEKQPTSLEVRKQRIGELLKEARRLVAATPDRYEPEKMGDFVFDNFNLRDDLADFAQRKWYLSRATARDYAQVVIGELDASKR